VSGRARVLLDSPGMSLFEPFPTLQTERLRLRAVTLADAPEMFQQECDPRVTRYIGRRGDSLPAMEAKVAGIIADVAAGRSMYWVLGDIATGALLGSVCLWRWDQARGCADVGYLLSPSYWGRGLVSEALVPALEFGFARMGLARVEGWVHPDNLASIRVLRRLGFTEQVGVRGEPDEHGIRDAVYALTRA
jgi:ribosomal-protein-alanine N-acetyltransferase